MTRHVIFGLAAILTMTVCGDTNAPEATAEAKPLMATNVSAGSTSISTQEMLVNGHPTLKLHSLALMTQGQAEGGVDETFLPGFKVCSEEPSIPVRSLTAQLLGEHFVEGKETPNPEAVALLIKLAKDESSHVRYSAVYYGLTQIQNKSPEIVELLIDVACTNQEPGLCERIGQSLEHHREETTSILDRKLMEDNPIVIYEIYEDLAGKKPANEDKYLDMPSSRPKIFIFRDGGENAEAFKAELEAELSSIGLDNPELFISGGGSDYKLMLKTYITRDRIAVENAFTNKGKFTITQAMWLSPKLENRIDAMRKAGE